MNYQQKICTVESVTAGHPDKMADQISDAILDAYLAGDPESRVAIETFGGHGLLVIGGEVTSQVEVEVEKIARQVYADIGYKDELEIINRLVKQSPDIALGVDSGGAGDQGIMYGYATDATVSMMPMGVELAQKLTTGLTNLRQTGILPWLGPDGKAQVTLEDEQVRSVLISTQHSEDISQEEILMALKEKLIAPILGDLSKIEVLVNPTGRFVLGGFAADTGLTGRKIMVDTYGGMAPHGGGAFSGKDPSKVDRSAAYMCRYVAKNLVAAGLAQECLVSVAYAIGRAEPLMLEAVDANGQLIEREHLQKYDFRPRAIIEKLNLKRPIYRATASGGHFGQVNFPWEQVDG